MQFIEAWTLFRHFYIKNTLLEAHQKNEKGHNTLFFKIGATFDFKVSEAPDTIIYFHNPQN